MAYITYEKKNIVITSFSRGNLSYRLIYRACKVCGG